MTEVNDVIIDGIHLGKVCKRANASQKQRTQRWKYIRDTYRKNLVLLLCWCCSFECLWASNPATTKRYLSMSFVIKLSVCWKLDQNSCKWSDLGAATTRSWQRILYFTGLIVLCMFLAESKAWRLSFLNYSHVDGNARPFSSLFELLEPTVSYVGLKCWVAIAVITFFNHIYLFASRRIGLGRDTGLVLRKCWILTSFNVNLGFRV